MARKRKHSSAEKASAKPYPTGKTGRVRKKASAATNTTGAKSDVSDFQASASQHSLPQTQSNSERQNSDFCEGCGSPLIFLDETKLCGRCNSDQSIELAAALSGQMNIPDGEDQQFIECPGASLYDNATGMVTEGADFIEHENGAYEAKIVKRPHFPPGHLRRRLVPRSAFGRIRRCQACQDYTVRLRRREGVDFCIPSSKFPHRTKLKSVDIVSHRRPS